jgi:organic hydroperoxide reductase OsmC/OhrA
MMSEHRAYIEWRANESDFITFTPEGYSRDHQVTFPNGEIIHGSSAVDYFGSEQCVDPESLLAAALSSCHMLTFLAIANKQKLRVLNYRDNAIAELGKNAQGKMAVTKIILHPKVEFDTLNPPDAKTLATMHERAHKACFIANSIAAEVEIAE